MSLPFYDVACSGCSYNGRYSFNVWYEFEDGREAECQPSITQGWCTECDRVLTIYMPFSLAEARKEITEWEDFKREQHRSSIRHKIFGMSKERQSHIARANTKIEQIKACAEFFKAKTYPNRCLTCGSSNVCGVSLPDEYGHAIPIGVMHSCGGQLVATMSGRIAYRDLPKVVYNIAGDILYDERS